MIDYKSLVESLSNGQITKKEYDDAIEKISQRTNKIWRFICKVSERKLDWWAFSNDVSLGRGNGSTGGYFDPETDSEYIELTGDCGNFLTDVGDFETYDNPHYLYHTGFPTELLWDNNWKTTIESHVKNSITKAKEERAAKLLKNKEKKARKKEKEKNQSQMLIQILDKVKSVLTEEEHTLLTSKLRR